MTADSARRARALRGFACCLAPVTILVFLSAACAQADHEPLRLPPADAFYVGSKTCVPCHARIAGSFASTGMGRSLYPLGSNAGRYARIPDAIDIPSQGVSYAIFEEEGGVRQKQYQLDDAGREIHADTREVRYVIGSGNHSRSFVTVEGDRHYQMPLCWYPEADRWDLCPGFESRNHYFARGIDDTCLFCHNGRVRTDGRFSNRFEEPFPYGIGCERCHGPGSAHVELWSDPGSGSRPADPNAPTDGLIVNPARLPPDRSIEICMQCHLGDSAQTERVLMRRDALLDYRPGLPLARFMAVFRYRQKLPGSFGLTGQADRLSLSRCYTESAGALQCITCHDPHLEVYDVTARDPGHFNAVCAGCHGADGCSVPAASRDGDCVRCHMRRAEPHDQRHTTFLDHWIRRRPGDDLDATRDDFTLEPFFTDQSRYLDPARAALALGRAYYNKKVALGGTGGPTWELSVEALEESVRLDPGDPSPRFYLGKIESARGRLGPAEEHFRAAVAADPNHVDSVQELGSVLLRAGKLDESTRQLERALSLGPRGDDEGAVYNELGRVAMQKGDDETARARFGEALEVEPFGFESLTNMSLLDLRAGRQSEAIARLTRALKYAPNHAAIHAYLAEALARPGPARDPAAALEEARTATRLAPSSPAAWLAQVAACRAARRAGCALEAARRAVMLSPNDPEALLAHGRALLETGRPSEAVAPLRLALRIRPDMAAAETTLGRIYLMQKNNELAREHLARGAALGDDEARRLLAGTDPEPRP